jgi:hypothetical protein
VVFRAYEGEEMRGKIRKSVHEPVWDSVWSPMSNAVRALVPTQSLVFLVRHVRGLVHGPVAHVWGPVANTVRVRVER